MKFTISKHELTSALNVVGKSVSTNAEPVILTSVKITAEGNSLKLNSFNLETAATVLADATVHNDGDICVPFKLFDSIVGKLEDNDVTVYDDKNTLFIKSGKSSFQIGIYDSKDFPEIPQVQEESKFSIKTELITDMFKRAIPFAATSEGKKAVLMGLLLEINETGITIVASDGHRIAELTAACESNINNSFIIPAQACKKVCDIFKKSGDTITISSDMKGLIFSEDKVALYVRLIDGEFLNYKTAFAGDYKIKASLNKRMLINCVDRMLVIINSAQAKGGTQPIVVHASKDSMNISCKSDRGIAAEELSANIDGGEITIGFNAKFISDVLNACSCEDAITLQMIEPTRGCKIDGDRGDRYIILPVRLIG